MSLASLKTLAVVLALSFVAAVPGFAQEPYTFAGGSPGLTAPNPWFITFNPAGTVLAVVNMPLTVAPDYQDSISMFTVNPNGGLSPVAGSPFPIADVANAVAFNPSGTLMAVTQGANSFAIYSVSPTGSLSLLSTNSTVSPVTVPISVTFNSSGLLAVAYTAASAVATYSVSPSGVVTQVGTASTGPGSNPASVAFNPAGTLMATANSNNNTVSMFSVAAGGSLTPAGTISTGAGTAPGSVAFNANGQLLATANELSNSVSMFQVAANGALTQLGAPLTSFPSHGTSGPHQVIFHPSVANLFAVALPAVHTVTLASFDSFTGYSIVQEIYPAFGATSVAFGRSGGVLAIAESAVNATMTYVTGPPTVTFNTPHQGGEIGPPLEGFPFKTAFTCKPAAYAPPIASCLDQDGHPSGTALDTSTPGPRTFTVTATSSDGQTTTSSIDYSVIPGPTATISSPASGGVYLVGQVVPTSFSCDQAPGGPALFFCSDSVTQIIGSGESHLAGSGTLKTSTAGSFTYRVAGCSGSGFEGGCGDATISYTVVTSAAATALSTPVVPTSGGLVGSPVTATARLSRTDAATLCVAGQSVVFTWTLPNAGTATQTATTGADGTASVSFTPTAKGIHAVSASFAGGTCLLSSASSAASVTVYQPMALSMAPVTTVCGPHVEIKATLRQFTDGGLVAPAGQTVAFTFVHAGVPEVHVALTDANGIASTQIDCDSAGTSSAQAKFFNPGDFYTNRSGSLPPAAETAAASLVLSAANTGLSATAPAAGLFPGPINVSATLARVPDPSGPIGSALVGFEVAGPAGTPTISALTNTSGVATTSFATPARGTYTVTARFAGDPVFVASAAAPVQVNVYQKTLLHLNPIAASAGSATAVTATLTTDNTYVLPDGEIISAGGLDRPLPGQVVTFNFGGATPSKTAVTDANGVASVSVVFASPATITATASFLNAADFYTNSAGALPPAAETASAPATVTDTTPPTIDPHPGVSAPATSGAGAIVTFTSPASHDAVSGDGTATCTPGSGSTFAPGPTTVTCTARDAAGNSASTSFIVTVTNAVPIATNDTYSSQWNTPLTVAAKGVLTNDIDANNDPLTAILGAGPSHGTLALTANGGFTYTPAPSYYGPDSFTYKADDGRGGISGLATVNLTITTPCPARRGHDRDDHRWWDRDDEDDDANCARGTAIAHDDVYSTRENTPLMVAAGDGVLDNDGRYAASALLVTTPAHGTVTLNTNGSLVYVPAAGFYGIDSFLYTAKSGTGIAGPTARVRIIVKRNLAPDADNDFYSTKKKETLTVNVNDGVLDNDSDPNRDPITAVLVSGPSHGTLTVNANGSFVYKPDSNFTGTDTFTYKAKDPAGLTDTATVTIRVGVSKGRDDDDRPSKHYRGDRGDHETGRGGHFDGDDCEYDRLFRR